MNRWKLYHTYNLLVESGDAAEILCPDCLLPVFSIIDVETSDPTPALYCPACDSVLRPGLYFWDQIKAVVAEHYVDQL